MTFLRPHLLLSRGTSFAPGHLTAKFLPAAVSLPGTCLGHSFFFFFNFESEDRGLQTFICTPIFYQGLYLACEHYLT